MPSIGIIRMNSGRWLMGWLATALIAGLVWLPSGCGSRRPAPQAPQPAVPALTLAKVADGFSRPTYLTHSGDGSGRLFVTEQPGRVRVIRDGRLLAAPFLDLTAAVRSSGRPEPN